MKSNSHPCSQVTKLIPPEIFEIFGPPPLLSAEETEAYYALMTQLARDIAPRDPIAWMHVKDVVDYFVEILRLRRIRSAIAQHSADSYLKKADAELGSYREVDIQTVTASAGTRINDVAKVHGAKTPEGAKLIGEVSAKRDADVAAIEKKYARARANLEALKARPHDVLALRLDEWIHPSEKVDKLIEIYEKRLHGALLELERHMCGFGRTLRERLETIIDGEVVKTDEHSRKRSGQ